MALRLLVPAALLVTIFSGCLESQTEGIDPSTREATSILLSPAKEPLWYHPQTFPHPAFNFPTLSNPAEGAFVSQWLKPIPANPLPAKITGFDHLAQVEGTRSGAGMSLVGSIAVLPSSPTTFVDVRDPLKPVVVGSYDGGTRGSDNIIFPDGRIVTVLAGNDGKIHLVDITNPEAPEPVSQIEPKGGVHKVDVVPGTPIIYNAGSDGGGGAGSTAFGIQGNVPALAEGFTEIFDASDPENPIAIEPFENGYGCHRIYFYIEPAREFYRAYCAGIEMTQIWDIADPYKPTLVVNIPVWHGNPDLPANSAPPVTFSHFSIANEDATILVVGDEMGGGLAAACTAEAATPVGDKSAPTGALWFYDISDEQNPELMGWISPRSHFADNPTGAISCTAHHGRLVPDPEGKRDLIAMGYYGQGVVLVDFTDPSNPWIVDTFNDGTDVWEAWYYNGYVFTGDGARGLDVLGLK